jgi:hypothetical protein
MAQDDPYAATAEAPADPYASTADTDTLSEGGTKQKRPGVLEGIERGKNDVINVFKPLSADERQQFESTFGKVPGAALEGVSNATLGVASAGASLLLHPLGSIYGSAQMAADALNQIFPDAGLNPQQKAAKDASLERLKTQWESIKENPDWAMGNIVGGIYAGKAIGDAVGPVTKGLMEKAGNARRTVVETATGTGPRVTAELVGKVKAGNEAADAYSSLRARIETAREKALKIGNDKYAAVNPSLNPIEADPEFMQGAISDALESLKGSKSEPTLLKDITKKMERGDAFTYEDLQGDYSRLGKEISKGTLPGDEYHAYDQLHEAIGEEMQRIADSEGKGAELKDARDYWRRMKQTFGKPLTQPDAATGVLRSASPDLAEQDTIANRVRLLGSFDSDIPTEFKRLSEAQEKSKGAPKPTPGESGKINERDIRAAKETPIKKSASSIRSVGYRLGLIWPVLDVIRDVVRGEMPSLTGTVGGGFAIAGGSHAIASLLERPAVIEFLTKPTDADIREIPPEMRGDLKIVVEAAQRKGIKVDPTLAALIGATAPKGPKTKKLEDDANYYRTHAR